MPNLWQAFWTFYNSPQGRKIVNWGTTALGILIAAGVIPLDTPIGPTSLGQLLTVLGLRLPSTPPVKPSALRVSPPSLGGP